MTVERILRLPAVEAATGLKRDSIYRGGREGWFPKPIRITPTGFASGWRESEVQTFIHERIAASRTADAR